MALNDWKKEGSFRGKYNQRGGTQSNTTYENKKAKQVLEIGRDRPHYSEKGWHYVSIRNHNWDPGKWETKEFDTKPQALTYAKRYMRGV